MDSTQKKYQIGTPENRAFLAENAEGLLTFGHRFPSPGGGSYYLGDDGTPWKDRSRETWITARMCHVYSLGVFLGHPGSAELADAALKGLCGELHDTENGGGRYFARETVLRARIRDPGSIQRFAGRAPRREGASGRGGRAL